MSDKREDPGKRKIITWFFYKGATSAGRNKKEGDLSEKI